MFLPDGTRVGELDEEMVHESRPGETFVLGASTWRIEDITHERVVVTPAPGPARASCRSGTATAPAAPTSSGAAIGAFHREVRAGAEADRDAEVARLQRRHDLDAWAADNLVGYLEEQLEATGALPDDRTIVVERFRDELGDWRVCILSPFGAQVHAPWAMALERRLATLGLDPEVMWADDGIVLRLQESFDYGYDAHYGTADGEVAAPSATRDATAPSALLTELLIDPDEVEQLVVDQLAARRCSPRPSARPPDGRCCCPKRRPGQRTALWQQRQRAADLLEVASRYPTFPILLEATREVLQDVFDLPALKQLLADLRSRKVRVATVDTATRRRRSPSRCCSAGSASTCTSTTRRWPNAARPRWRSTATCCASCSAATSCATCSTPTCWSRSNASCSGSAPPGRARRRHRRHRRRGDDGDAEVRSRARCPTGGPATPTSCTTCCAASAT